MYSAFQVLLMMILASSLRLDAFRVIKSSLNGRRHALLAFSAKAGGGGGGVDGGDEYMSPLRLKVNKILSADSSIVGSGVKVQGWVRTVRDQKNFAFIEVNDGSSISGIQAIAESAIASYPEVARLSTGAAVEIVGTIAESIGKGQKYEIKADSLKLIGSCPPETYPLQKKKHSQEFLRTIAHLRPRTNTIAAVARVRSALAFAAHKHFHDEGFIYVQTPLITASDCEGAGQMFRVTTLPIDTPNKIPVMKDGNTNFLEDFFSKPTFLTVSGQLSGETFASALGDIYTFGPTFRAEKSQTTRHLAEFHMIEPEMAFCDLNGAMDGAERFVKGVIAHALSSCKDDLAFFEKFYDKTLTSRLSDVVGKPFVRISYKDAIKLLQDEIEKDPSLWQFPEVKFGTDLATEHERWLSEKKFNSCVFVHNYPRFIKSFYMRDGEGDDKDTCDSFDLLVPGVGELIGGSAREERLENLRSKLTEFKLKEEDYSWYLDLRRFGSVPHAGYGLGFERLVCYATGIENIREAIAFPRYLGNADF